MRLRQNDNFAHGQPRVEKVDAILRDENEEMENLIGLIGANKPIFDW